MILAHREPYVDGTVSRTSPAANSTGLDVRLPPMTNVLRSNLTLHLLRTHELVRGILRTTPHGSQSDKPV
ncbi:hypothetical protein P692DRAFT_201781665 [Suillus brevipes Sb2]|nr:hypothetical protein P692DRAFT_201781665 [Suillus brevipes Sb2]